MRGLLFALFAVWATLSPATADQTDARLDGLFESLRRSGEGDAVGVIDQIFAIWSDSKSDTVNLLFTRAEQSADAGAYKLSHALLEHIVALSPNFAQAYALRGMVRLSQDDRSGAMADFARTIELEPRHFEARLALAELLVARGEPRAAYEMVQQALLWNPHDQAAVARARKLRRDIEGQEI